MPDPKGPTCEPEHSCRAPISHSWAGSGWSLLLRGAERIEARLEGGRHGDAPQGTAWHRAERTGARRGGGEEGWGGGGAGEVGGGKRRTGEWDGGGEGGE